MSRGLAGFPKTLTDEMRGLPRKNVRRSRFWDTWGQELREPRYLDQGPRTSSQFLQEEFRSHYFVSDEAKLKSIGGGLGETFAKMSQVYRQRVTHLKSDGGSSAKDEKEQRLECKAELPASTVAATALPRWTIQHRRKGLLLLNPVTYRQFLTLFQDVMRLSKIAKVPNKLPNNIYVIVGSGKIENRAMYVK